MFHCLPSPPMGLLSPGLKHELLIDSLLVVGKTFAGCGVVGTMEHDMPEKILGERPFPNEKKMQ